MKLDESVDPDLDWACRMTLLEMNSDPDLVDHICHTLTYESVVSLCLNDGEPLTEASLRKGRKKKLTVQKVKAMAHLVYKRWQHIDKERAAKKAANKARELAKQATSQGRKKASAAARAAVKMWNDRAKQFAKQSKSKTKKRK
jgi:hypothetical protein